MIYPQEILEEIRMRNDIVEIVSNYLPLKQKSGRYYGLCPFHNEKTPSFSVNEQLQVFHCFGCGASGNVYSFVMQMENYDFPDTIKFLADRVHYTLPEAGRDDALVQKSLLRDKLFAVNKRTARFYYDQLETREGGVAKRYLDTRCIQPRLRIKFGLGYAPAKRGALLKFLQNDGTTQDLLLQSGLFIEGKHGLVERFVGRLMFPIFDVRGRIVGFGGRILATGEPKYLNSPETLLFNKSGNLYGINFARLAKKKELILVEGYMDVLSLFEAGFTNAVAALGTAFNMEHARLIRKYADSVVVLFDSDAAGEKAALRAIPVLLTAGLRVKVLQVTGAKDPDEYIQLCGATDFGNLMTQAMSHILFQINVLEKQYDLAITEDRVLFTQAASKILATLESDVERAAYVQEIAKRTKIDAKAIDSEVNKTVPPSMDVRLPRGNANYILQNQLSEKGMLISKKMLLYLAASDAKVSAVLMQHITPAELGDAIYEKLMDVIITLHTQNHTIVLAEVLNYFNTPEEQKMVADVFREIRTFHEDVDWDSRLEMEKTLSQIVKKIKIYNLEQQRKTNTDIQTLQKLAEMRKNIEELYITITDG